MDLELSESMNITQGGNTKATSKAEWNFGSSALSLGRKSENVCEEMSSCGKILSSQRTQVCSKGETNYLLSP